MDRIALVDSMILSYLAAAISPGYVPGPGEDLDQERVAALRLFLWARIGVGEVAVLQSRRTSDRVHRKQLDDLVAVMLPEYRIEDWKLDSVEIRVVDLASYHSDREDCRIVAEAEALGAEAVVTFDKTMQKRLREAAGVMVLSPSAWWAKLAIPRGTPPRLQPHETNPLAGRTFWRWD